MGARALIRRSPRRRSSRRRVVEEWARTRPATTIVGSFRPDIVAAPGYRSDVSRQDAEGGVEITEAEALILQDLPADYPLCGTKTRRFLQIGNAVPPSLAFAALAPLVGQVREAE